MLQQEDQARLKEKPIVPQRHWLRSGMLECIYEHGYIRYISSGAGEIVRSVYPALRDQLWQTAPSLISEERIEQFPDGFQITYQADYALDDLRYTALVSITCREGTSLTVTFSGTARSNFLRNRIGLCALLPPAPLRGKACVVGHPDCNREILTFPETIHPVRPFLNIRSLDWEAAGNIHVRVDCSGDVFEMEDQRNWGDASFKIYSTEQHLPMPVAVRNGDTVQQEIRFTFRELTKANDAGPAAYAPVVFKTGNHAYPFPGIGCSYNADAQAPDADTIKLLRRLALNHYRIELFIPGEWKQVWEDGRVVARQLGAALQVVIFAGDNDPEMAVRLFLTEVAAVPAPVSDLLLFAGTGPVANTAVLTKLAAEISAVFPGIRCGSGTDTFFADWNQQPAIPESPGSFIALPVNPQVHLTDDTTIVENLPAMTDIIETARFHSPAARIFMGPVTLKMRYDAGKLASDRSASRFPYRADHRQSLLFAASWTAVALRYLCRADKITLFEITGERGLMPAHSPEAGLAAVRIYPVYLLLREIAAFKPKKILLSRSLRPTDVDGLVIENTHGDRLMIFANFTPVRQTLQVKTESWKALPLFGKSVSVASVAELLEDGEKFRSAPYVPFLLSEGNNCRLPPGGLLFLTTLQDWSFS